GDYRGPLESARSAISYPLSRRTPDAFRSARAQHRSRDIPHAGAHAMARGVNKVILIGNLGADPETRYTANGGAITTIRIATSEAWKDKTTGEQQERTEWH